MITKDILQIAGRTCYIYKCSAGTIGSGAERSECETGRGAPCAGPLLIQPADDHDISVLDSEAAHIERLITGTGSKTADRAAGARGFTLAAFKVNDWNQDLSPWEAPPVFGDAAFGSGAAETLEYITGELLPYMTNGNESVYLGGYSLAGLFSLWAGYQTDAFAGIAACSPSVWFPGWTDFVKAHPVKSPHIYLSLGDKEEKTRNPVMRTVGDCIRMQLEILKSDPACAGCTLEMSQGNHFKEPDLRTAKGFAWLLTCLYQ